MKRCFRLVRALGPILATALAACASTGPAPVEDRSIDGPRHRASSETPPARPSSGAAGGTYRVERGDTLYSIAFRHGVDFRDLATWNGIGAPYTIYVGRELRMTSPSTRTVASTPGPSRPSASSPATARSPATQMPKPEPFEPVSSTPPQVASASTPSSQASTAVVAGSISVTKPAVVPPVAPIAAPPIPAPPVAAGDVSWRWPADGQVVGGYVSGDPTKQGMDIAGKAGDPVRAAGDGTVVYSGNGLIGYGELIIVKHNPNFLSAYGHNRKRLVTEGDRVNAGQTIAEMGSSSASRDSLHFEIRKNGKPANPVDYLPRR
ncbi:MAG: peptidoglycan DD-metalloendopeptidase family protein [Dokdonella sp.]|uniref:peptidoglycan DD-metalloendopeptidase family protein n=1 Tax=Dokdonella sp. TaxID=2291710 RepID=UPI003265E6E4